MSSGSRQATLDTRLDFSRLANTLVPSLYLAMILTCLTLLLNATLIDKPRATDTLESMLLLRTPITTSHPITIVDGL